MPRLCYLPCGFWLNSIAPKQLHGSEKRKYLGCKEDKDATHDTRYAFQISGLDKIGK